MKKLLQVTKALADENRLRIMAMVKEKEPCVCQVVEVLGIAPSTASKHLSILKTAGLIDCYKDGRWVYYHLPRNPEEHINNTLRFIYSCLKDSEAAQLYMERVSNICDLDPSCLTRSQKQS